MLTRPDAPSGAANFGRLLSPAQEREAVLWSETKSHLVATWEGTTPHFIPEKGGIVPEKGGIYLTTWRWGQGRLWGARQAFKGRSIRRFAKAGTGGVEIVSASGAACSTDAIASSVFDPVRFLFGFDAQVAQGLGKVVGAGRAAGVVLPFRIREPRA